MGGGFKILLLSESSRSVFNRNLLLSTTRTHDFVVAATSPNLNGTEEIRNPGGSSRGGCFVATAAYGTPLASEIDPLRIWRDGMLLDNALGTASWTPTTDSALHWPM